MTVLSQRALREHGCVPLDDRRARELRNAGKKADEWRDRRDELIRLAHAEGGSLREIADAVGMSNPGVLRVIRRALPLLEAHHIPPVAEGGAHELDNLELIDPNEHARRHRDG